ncbi:MAG: glycoside hydrolase family 26 protein [Duncaniella sp.]|jgi:mannan endo-1,4-beta-mannosidase
MKHIAICALVALATSCGTQATQTAAVNEPKPPTVADRLIEQLHNAVDSGHFYFGHHDDTAYGHTWRYVVGGSDVKAITGEYPGLMSWDLGMIELDSANNLDGVPFDFMAGEIARQHARGGINAISWHPRNPLSGGDSWDVSTSPLREMESNKALKVIMTEWIDRAGRFIASLKDSEGNPIPVIFRPWHENSGSWFWWGAANGDPEQYIALWHLTRERFDSLGIDNVVWAYSPDKDLTREQYFSTYPGDDYVDILGSDIYHFGGEAGVADYMARIKAQLPYVAEEAAKRGKIAAFTETGLEGLEVTDWYTRVLQPSIEGLPIAYVCVWRNAIESEKPNHFYAPYPGHPAAADFKKWHDESKAIFVK